ncbi:hypothetical protein [Nocardiopsis synnemataformans]|uniref:hypothetical protein n=1 Tax=Nocardiopsis synnemataformans TaxID=61305 RepID=UPI003EB7DE6E
MDQNTQVSDTPHVPTAPATPRREAPRHLFDGNGEVMKTIYGTESMWVALDRVATGREGATVVTYMAARHTEDAVHLTGKTGALAAWTQALSGPVTATEEHEGVQTYMITGSLNARTVTIVASIAGGQE